MSIPQELARDLVERYGTINRASRKADIPLTTLYRLYNREREGATFKTVSQMAQGLDENLPDAIRRIQSRLQNGDDSSH